MSSYQTAFKGTYRTAYRTAYHGTSKAALASILEKGLIPGASPGADAWASHDPMAHFGTRPGIFLSPLPSVAAVFSQFAAQVRSGAIGRALVAGGVVLEVDLQAADPDQIELDRKFSRDNMDRAFIFRGAIPARQLRSYCEVTPTEKCFPLQPYGGFLSESYFDHPSLKLGEPVLLKAAA